MLISTSKGNIPWLFDDAFCRFTDFHVCLNVGIGYNRGSLCKLVVSTTCPDRFLGKEGQVPPGCLSVTVTAHHDSTKIKHHMVPAVHLTAAPPRAKGQKCLILKGEIAGQIRGVKECKLRKQQVILSSGVMLPLDDVCLVIEARA